MKKSFHKWLNSLIQEYLQNENSQVIFPQHLVLLLRIQYALLNMAYIYGRNNSSYLHFIILFARPQLYLPLSDITAYVVLIFCILHILMMFSIIRQITIVGVFSQLIRCGMLNFFFEYSVGMMSFITHSILIFISLIENLIIQGTLNVMTVNFQRTRFTLLDLLGVFLNYTLMIIYSYKFDNETLIIIAIALNLLRTFNQLLFSSFKTITTKTCVLTVKIMTIYSSIFWLANIQNTVSTEIILIPLLYRMIHYYYNQKLIKILLEQQKSRPCDIIQVLIFLGNLDNIKQIIVIKPRNNRDRIIYATFLMFKGQNYQAFLELISIKKNELNILEQFKIQITIQRCLNRIYNTIEIKQYQKCQIKTAVKSLMESEQGNFLILNEIIELMKEKILCLKLLIHTQTSNTHNKYLIYIEKLFKYKEKLEKQYKTFPCEKTQSILGFFYAELMNDYLPAYSLFSIIAVSDEKINRVLNNQDIFSNKMIYLITKFDGSLIIQRPSNEAFKVIGINNNQLIGMAINQIIPPSINNIHDELVLQFLKTGESKFMRNISNSYLYRNNSQQMESIELFFEINLIKELSFIVFIQPPSHQLMTIILNERQEITCISNLIIEELKLHQYYQQFYGIHINKVLPNFPQHSFDNQQCENDEAHFDQYDEHSVSSSQSAAYLTSYQVKLFNFKDKIAYYLIQFEYFRKQMFFGQSSLSNQSPTIQLIRQKFGYKSVILVNNNDAEGSIDIPYEDQPQQSMNALNSFLKFSPYDNSPTQTNTLQQLQKTEAQRNSLEITNIKSTCKQTEALLGTQKFFSKPKVKHTSTIIFQEEREIQQPQSSIVSSLQGIRNSKYFQQIQNVSKMGQLQILPKQQQLFIFMLILLLLIQIIIQTIQLVKLNISLGSLAADIDLLQIKNFVFQPLETFLLTRWTIFNYNMLKDAGSINQEEYDELVIFPKSNLNLGYDQLDENLKQVFNRPALQNFLENTYLDVYQYMSSNTGERYNLSLRNTINIMKNYEYDCKMAYQIDGNIVTDSPYVYFQYRNYLPIKNLFSELNQIVYEQTKNRSQQIYIEMQIISILTISLFIFLIFIISYYFYKTQKMIGKHFRTMEYVQVDFIEQEIEYIKNLQDNLIQDQNFLLKYQFKLEQKEKQLQTILKNKLHKKKETYLFHCHQIGYYFLFLFIIITVIGNGILTFYEGYSYLIKYPQTAEFYKSVSDVGTDVPTMFAQRDVLYSRNTIIPYFSQSDIDNLLNEIINCLNRTQQFIQQDYDFNKYLISNQFQTFYQNIQHDNLCNYLPTELQNNSKQICPEVMNQNLLRGLQSVLVYIANYINTDLVINQFQTRTEASYLELEGAFLVSNVINVVNDQFNQDLASVTYNIIISIDIHNIIILFTLLFTILFIFTYVKQKVKQMLFLSQRLIFLLPMRTLIIDPQFERSLRLLLAQYQEHQ